MHEAIAGRNAEDVDSAYCSIPHGVNFRDYKNLFPGQTTELLRIKTGLYTAIVGEVNCSDGPDSVTIKYLEQSHTFMSADSFHVQIEKGVRSKRNLS